MLAFSFLPPIPRRDPAEFNPWAASRVAVQLLATADSLELLPRRGRPGRLPGKWELVSVQPFVIVCRVGASVEILRVWHGAQRH